MHKLNNCTDIKKRIIFIFLLFSINNLFITASFSAEGDESDIIKTVVIDAGHGGKDPGALGKFSKEKDVVLSIALKLGQYIETNIDNVKVVYTRKEDVFVPLHERAEIANKCQADLFISIHANGMTDSRFIGTETLVLGLHRANENFEVAKQENSVILLEDDYTTRYEGFDPNSPESYIIFSLMQNIYLDQSISYAKFVQDQFRERVRRIDRGVKQQGLLVLAQTAMPGVLIETGFITNRDEEKYLNSEEGQDYLASAIYRAFKDYKENIEEKSRLKTFTNNSSVPVRNNNKVSSNKINDSILFKVQITASTQSIPLNSNIFKDFNDITELKTGNYFKYAVGEKGSYEEIVEFSKQVKNRFPDAFIIALKNGQMIPVEEALKEINN